MANVDLAAEHRLLRFLMDPSWSPDKPWGDAISFADAADATSLSESHVKDLVLRFADRGWISLTSSRAGWNDGTTFFARMTDEGMREVEGRPIKVQVDGPVEVAIAAIGGLVLTADDAERLRALLLAVDATPDERSKVSLLTQALGIASNATTSAEGLRAFLDGMTEIIHSIT
ncbi:MAG TPA: hypothetical protein VFQ54_08860 [Thermomicrobiales bacterium]|nr:hypothetical protein [Thermomicrobiales bacterium]